MKTRIRISKELILSMLVVLPYFAGRQLNDMLEIVLNDRSYIPAIIVLMLAVWIVFLFLNITARKRKIKTHFYTYLFDALMLYTLFGVFFAEDVVTSFSMWLWLCFPMVVSSAIIRYCRIYRLDYGRILVGMIYWFLLYTVVLLLHNMIRYGLFSEESYRMNSRAGGAVIYGYTVAVIFAMCICYKKHFSPVIYYSFLAILTLAAVGTGSRGAVWPILLLWVLNFLFEKLTRKRIFAGFGVGLVCLMGSALNWGNILDILSSSSLSLVNRLFNTEGGIRTITLGNAIDLFIKQNPLLSLFGRGIGNFFPYQDWAFTARSTANNTFIFGGKVFLVQPHNSFVYILIEGGLIGFILWRCFFIKEIMAFTTHKDSRSVFRIVFVCTVIFVNMFDSVFFVQPGVAMVYWLLLLLAYEDHNRMINHV